MTKQKKHINIVWIIGVILTVIWTLVYYWVQAWAITKQVQVNTSNISDMSEDMWTINDLVIETRNDVKWLVDNAKNK